MKTFNDVTSLAAATLTADQIVKVKSVGDYRIKDSGSGITLANGKVAVPEGMVSVKHFGAVGDGVTDDTAAIQAALDSHDTVFLPTGTYSVSSALKFNRGNRLIGDSMDSTAIVHSDGTTEVIYIDQSKASGAQVTDTYLANVRVSGGLSGIRIGENNSTNWGVKFTAERVWLYNNTVNLRCYNGWELMFFKCLFDQVGGTAGGFNENVIIYQTTGPAFQNTTRFEQCDFTNVDAAQNVKFEISNMKNTMFSNCVFQGGRGASTVAVKGTGSYLTGLTLSGCYFEDYANYFVELPASTSNAAIEISGCHFQDKAGRTEDMLSVLYSVLLKNNMFNCSNSSVAFSSAVGCELISNRRTISGTDTQELVGYDSLTNSTIMAKGVQHQTKATGGANGITNAVMSITKTIPAATPIDFFEIKVTDTYGQVMLDLNSVGRNGGGTNVSFSGKRLVQMNAGNSITVITVGTDYSSNSNPTITWTSSNTFKVQFGNGTGSTAGVAASVRVTGGGGNGDTGTLEFLNVL